jgi:hypothetical protein
MSARSKVAGRPCVGGELAREGDRLVADIHAGHGRAARREAEGILPGIALEVQQRQPVQVAEQREFLREKGAAARAQERRLIGLVAVVRDGRCVPRPAILLVARLIGLCGVGHRWGLSVIGTARVVYPRAADRD